MKTPIEIKKTYAIEKPMRYDDLGILHATQHINVNQDGPPMKIQSELDSILLKTTPRRSLNNIRTLEHEPPKKKKDPIIETKPSSTNPEL